MKEQLQQRLQSLKTEYEAGQKALADLEVKQAHVRDMVLRISGAIQVLEEVLTSENDESNGAEPAIGPSPLNEIAL
jgi:predicted nuclease with TOPRIM domain